jgi:hypothetical protein
VSSVFVIMIGSLHPNKSVAWHGKKIPFRPARVGPGAPALRLLLRDFESRCHIITKPTLDDQNVILTQLFEIRHAPGERLCI